jgi:membrane-associated phospholipid phosphatase
MAHTTGLVLACVLGSAAMLAQEPDVQALQPAESPTVQAEPPETAISPKELVKDVVHDQLRIFTFPVRAVHGKHWEPVLAIALTTIGLVALDPYTEPYFHDRSFDTYKTGALRGRNSTAVILGTAGAFYLVGLAKHSPHAQNTGMLAAEAIIDSQILTFAIKQAVGRLTPSQIPPNGDYRDTWFKYKGSLTSGGSFPSGHAASAFAVATVIAVRYRQHRWVPWVAYGAAALIALSRLPDQAHFPSDIFFGSALGFSISRFVVLAK